MAKAVINEIRDGHSRKKTTENNKVGYTNHKESESQLNEDHAMRKESIPIPIRKYIELLPKRAGEAITYRYLEGLSETETASAMNCSKVNVRKRKSDGLEMLRELLQSINF